MAHTGYFTLEQNVVKTVSRLLTNVSNSTGFEHMTNIIKLLEYINEQPHFARHRILNQTVILKIREILQLCYNPNSSPNPSDKHYAIHLCNTYLRKIGTYGMNKL